MAAPVDSLYFPATHAVHEPPFAPVDPALQVQLVKAALPAGELEFDRQALHVEFAEAPTAVEYVPAAQSQQVAAPVDSLYFPDAHAVHEPPFAPVDPALQVQSVEAALPSGEFEFDKQARQVAAPADGLYFPVTQAAHGPPFGPVDPALQVQLVEAALPAGELEFDGQMLHVEFVEVPTAVEYVPAPQSVHAADPVNTLYFPVAQNEHGPAFAPVDPALQVQLVKAALPAGELEFDGQALHPTLAEASAE